jgi:carboxylesterase
MKEIPKYAQPFFFEGNDQACLLIHGFRASPGQMRYLGEFLHQEGGYTASGILLPGHGSSEEKMEEFGWEDWLNSVRQEYQSLAKNYEKVYVIGLSMGGILSLILAEDYDLDKVISIAAPIKIFDKLAYLTPILQYFKRFKGDDQGLVQSKEDEYDIYYSATPLAAVPNLLKLIRLAKGDLAKISAPILIIQSRDDQTVKPISAEIIYQGVSSQDKELLWLDEGGHVCTINGDKELIHKQILKFLKSN